MNTESENQKLRWFISGLGIIALIINLICFGFMTGCRTASRQREQQAQAQQLSQQQQEQQAQARQQEQQQERERQEQIEKETEAADLKAAQDAAAEHARYLARYLNSGFSRKSGVQTVAVAVVSEDGAFNQAVTRALAGHLKSGTTETLPSFFKPEFVSDGLINDGFNDSAQLAGKLDLVNSLDGLLLARQTVSYASNPSLENVLTASMQLDVMAASLVGPAKSQTWTFTAVGSGFKEADARGMAEERLIKQINADTNMSLNLISPNNQ